MRIISFCLLLTIAYESLLTAKNPTPQNLYITNRTSTPITVIIKASYPDKNNKNYDQQATMKIAPSSSTKFTYNRNKYVINNKISYDGGLEEIIINGKSYQATVGNDGNQYFPMAQQPKGFSYNSISIYPNNRISYDTTTLVLN